MSIIAVDFGGTRIKVGLVDGDQISQIKFIDSHSKQGVNQALDRLSELIRTYDLSAVSGIGIALPTLVDVRVGRVLMSMKGKFEGIHEVDFNTWSKQQFDRPIRVENDVHAAILGEWKRGAGIGCDNLIMITLGTGIGTSVIVQGRPLRGPHAQTGNLGGHVVIDTDGFPCVCGGHGCAEAQQHLDAVQAIARADPRFARSALSSEPTIDYAAIFKHAPSDELARFLRDRTLGIWQLVVTSLVNQFDCERFIIGGGIMQSADVILPPLRAAIDRACTPWGKFQILPSKLGDRAGLVGMAVSLEEKIDYF